MLQGPLRDYRLRQSRHGITANDLDVLRVPKLYLLKHITSDPIGNTGAIVFFCSRIVGARKVYSRRAVEAVREGRLMRVWGKPSEAVVRLGVARAAVAGAKRQELMQEALQTVLSSDLVDRGGGWVEGEAHVPSFGP